MSQRPISHRSDYFANSYATTFRAAVLGTTCLFAAASLVGAAKAGALPTNGHYVAGKGEIGKAGQSLAVKQSSTTGIINWNSFSIGSANAVRFNNGSGATLNRVTGANISTIAGSLRATGSLYLMNSQGVIVSGSGRVVTGGNFVATSGTIADSAFSDRRFKAGTGNVVNRGAIVSGGAATLSGRNVADTGTIRGARVELNARDALIVGGTISARNADGTGGTVIATARHIDVNGSANISADGTNGGTVLIGGDIHGGAIRKDNFVRQNVRTAQTTKIANGAVISAGATEGAGGDIVIWSDGHTSFGGSIRAKGQTAGGFTEVSSHDLLDFTGTVNLTASHGATGMLLLDPENVTISAGATANGSLTSGTFTPSGDNSVLNVVTLENALATASVTITTGATGAQTGDIAVLAPILMSGNTTLTLDAYHSVLIEAGVRVAGGGTLSIIDNDGGTGGVYSLSNGGYVDFGPVNNGGKFEVNGTNYKLLYTMAQVQAINKKLTGDYALATSLDASTTDDWVPLGTNSAGAVLNANNGFSGIFEGLGNTISGLNINAPSRGGVGLFGYSSGAIRDVGLVGGSATGSDATGALVGSLAGTVLNAFSSASVDGSLYVGGLVGFASTGSTITQGSSIGAVTASSFYTGGLIGDNHGTIDRSFATGTVRGTSTVGGFVGYNAGIITNSYATGNVTGSGSVAGGFVGENVSGAFVNGSYETGTASGATDVGGFVGENDNGGDLGAGPDVVWDSSNNSVFAGIDNGGSTSQALSTAQMMTASNFASWSFGTAPGGSGWVIVDADGTLNNAGSAAGGTTPMLLTEYSTRILNAHQLQLMALSLSANYTLGANIEASVTAGGDVWGSTGFIPVGGNNAVNFTGSLAGNNDAIAHLTIDTSQDYAGLFGILAGSVSDLRLSNVALNATSTNEGALAGDSTGSVLNVSVSGTVVAHQAGGAVGGLFGIGEGAIVSATSTATVSESVGAMNIGGLVGDLATTGTIRDSYASGAVTGFGDDNVGGLVGYSAGEVISSHATGAATALSGNVDYVGGLIGEDNFGAILGSYATGAVSGDAGQVGGLIGHGDTMTIANSYATGVVSGTDSQIGGLAGVLLDTAVSNSHATGQVTDGYSTGTMNYAGGLVGFASGATLSDTYATGAVNGTGEGAAVGGLMGMALGGAITSSHATGAVTANSSTTAADGGGLIGEASTKVSITDSYATGDVEGDSLTHAGGLIGLATTTNTIDNTYATGNVTGRFAGGLIGDSETGNTILNSHASGSVTGIETGGGDFTGGLIGDSNNDAQIASDYATGAVDGGSTSSALTSAGGLIGQDTATDLFISNYATGSVSNGYNIGGLVGFFEGAMLNSYATGDVTAATSGKAGGLIGESSGSISYSYATGNVTDSGIAFVGGLVGYNFAAIDHSFATGNVVAGGNPEAGGLVGDNFQTIKYSYATGSITGDGNAIVTGAFGGLVGANRTNGNLQQVYSLGAVTGAGSGGAGGLAGVNSGTIGTAYWDTQTSGMSTSVGGTGLTTARLQQALPQGFSTSQWAILPGTSFPYLKWQFAGGTPEVISGTIAGPGNAGVSVDVLVNGQAVTPLVAMSSGANGYYYELLAPGTISAGNDVLAYEASGSNHADAFIQASGSIAGLNLTANTLSVDSSAANTSSMLTAMETALGTNTGSDFLYKKTGTFTSGIDLDLDLSAASFSVNSALDVGTGAIVLDSSGAVTETSTGKLIVANFSGKSSGSVVLTSSKNAIADLGAFTTGGNNAFSLTDNHGLTTIGTLNAGTAAVTLTTISNHTLAIDAAVKAGTVDLVSAGVISESSLGDINAITLIGSSNGGVDLSSTKNTVTDLGAFVTGGHNFALTDDHGLTVEGSVGAGAGTLSLTTVGNNHNLAIANAVTGKTVNLTTTGKATETSVASIVATTVLNVTAKSGITLTSTNNNIKTVGTDTTNTGPNKITL